MQQSDIAVLARNAGLSEKAAVTASAIAMAESGGNPAAHTDDADDNSYGLWQINMLGAMGPARRALYGLKSNEDLLDPVTNAHVMSAMSHQGQNFGPWTTYTSGRYKAWMPGGKSSSIAVGAVSKLFSAVGAIQDGVSTVADVATSAGQAVDALQRTATWIARPANWVRVAYVVGGTALVITALVQVITSTGPGKAAVTAGRKAVTKGLA